MSCPSGDLFEDMCDELVEDGPGPSESVVRSSRRHRSFRKVKAEARWQQQQQARRSRIRSHFFMEVNNLAIEEELGTWGKEHLMAWRNRSSKCRLGDK